jgi:two-component system, response regulator
MIERPAMQRTILLVEDSDDDADLTTRAFERAGVATRVIRAHDGAEALDLLRRARPEGLPEAVLLDLRLPRMDGLDVLKAIHDEERFRRLPVIVMTSSRDDEDRLAALRRGALSFVRKPVNYEDFVKAATTLGLHWSASISVFGTSKPEKNS